MMTHIPSKWVAGGPGDLVHQFPSIYLIKFIALTVTNLLVSAVQATLFDRDRPHSSLQMPTHHLIHTFETIEQCSTNCPKPCVMQIMEELEMMPRWICDPSLSQTNRQHTPLTRDGTPNARSLRPLLKDDGGGAGSTLNDNQFLLVITPFVCLLILCVIISLRRCSASSSMATI